MRGVAMATITTWLHGLNTFLAWLANEGISEVRFVTPQHLVTYQRWLGFAVVATAIQVLVGLVGIAAVLAAG